MDWRQKRSCSGVLYLLETARESDIATEHCLRGTAIDLAQLAISDETIEAWQELAVIRNLIERMERPGLGFATGRKYHLTTLGLLGFTMMASDTLASALAALDRFQSLALALCPVRTTADPRGLWVTFDESVIPRDASSFVVERGIGAVVNVVCELMQRTVTPLAAEVRFDRPAGSLTGYPAFARHTFFSGERSGVLFATADLQCALPQANHSARFQGEALCAQLIDEMDLAPSNQPLAQRVQRILLEHASSMLTAKQVADLLAVSDRTLHRHLAQEQTSFSALNDRVRMRLAKRLLSDSKMDLQGVAEAIGYAEAASFCRAFQRWTGESPGRWKRSS